MAIQLQCTQCWNSLQESDLTHIPHTDGTPVNNKHIGAGIHQSCLKNWVISRYTKDQPITCPLGCPDKLISASLIVSAEELRNRMPKKLMNRAINWIYERLAPPVNRTILLLTSAAAGATGAVCQIAVKGMTVFVRSIAWQSIPLSVIRIPGAGLSIAIGTLVGTVTAFATSGQGEAGLRFRKIQDLSLVFAAVSSVLGVIATQALLN